MAISQSKMSDLTNTKGKEVPVDVFHLDQIPDAMENMGWEMAPKLMRHWFSITPAFAFNESTKINIFDADARMLPASRVNNNIITMGWAKKFDQVSSVIKSLTAKWNTLKGREVLKLRLKSLGDYKSQCIFLGNQSDTVILDATSQVNYLRIGSKIDTINDWYGAMGNCNLKVCLKGYTTYSSGKYFFKVDMLGFYLKDTYDFLDDNKLGINIPEFLGVWNKERILNKVETTAYMSSYTAGLYGQLARYFSGSVPVFNYNFREWQSKNNSGGDFIVLSDVLWLPPLEMDKEIEL
ncbi:hypothetical protein JK232_21195 [Nissabacter archeti]|uniref:Uncharacterized protein n=1 Tax=Nissabacter archeti TaxID=1917880 RepID=A0ABS5JNP7_9GAMM|nr:DUF6402 family protein [Nissabacter archeti]MBS0971404.1 hypothetical protein [Nissabacter archeti]